MSAAPRSGKAKARAAVAATAARAVVQMLAVKVKRFTLESLRGLRSNGTVSEPCAPQ